MKILTGSEKGLTEMKDNIKNKNNIDDIKKL